MLCFDILDKIKLILEFPDDNIQRFSWCKVLYKYNEIELNVYEDKDIKRRKEMLEKAVSLNDKLVYPCEELGWIFMEKGEKEKAREMIQRAIKNVKKYTKMGIFMTLQIVMYILLNL